MREPTDILPDEIATFLHGDTRDRREESWTAFLARHNRLLLRVAYAVAPNREDAMDAYAIILEQLREHDARRLRSYRSDGRSKFTTWLVVVARRICVDFLRQRYGRYVPTSRRTGKGERLARLALAELVGAEVDAAIVVDENAVLPDESVRSEELSARLADAVRALSNDDRLLLKLRFEDDLSASAIARLVGAPTPFHVYRRLNAILSQLRQALESRGFESSEG
jgi:RNA polymerase sigma factor (sigma-70 family)